MIEQKKHGMSFALENIIKQYSDAGYTILHISDNQQEDH